MSLGLLISIVSPVIVTFPDLIYLKYVSDKDPWITETVPVFSCICRISEQL